MKLKEQNRDRTNKCMKCNFNDKLFCTLYTKPVNGHLINKCERLKCK